MRYRYLLVALLISVAGTPYASTENPDEYQYDTGVDDRVTCIEAAIADEVDQDRFDQYVDECVQEIQAKRQQPARGKG